MNWSSISGEKIPYKFSTQVSIVPDVLPHRIEEYRAKQIERKAKP